MMNILGTACLRRSRGGLSQNIEEARIAFEAALEVRTRAAHPRPWAYIQNNLAVLYRERLDGDPAENVEQAIAAGTGALEILNPDEDFAEWVMATNNLASAYRFRILGDIQTFTAQGRLTGAILSALPICIGLFSWAMAPEYFKPMVESPAGRAALCMAGLMQLGGALVIRRIVDVKV